MDLDQYRQKSLESWDRFAANWEEERDYVWEMTRPVSERMVERLEPSSGDTVLELAAGTGETGFLAAERIGAEGGVISTDFAPAMVESARRRSEELGLSNFEHRVLDAERMDLDDDSVDGVVCRFGYMLMADPAAALQETRRVLRDGGRVSFAVWGPPDRNMWAFIPGLALVELGHMPMPEPGSPGIFAMGDPDRIRELVTGAGFSEPTIDQVPVNWAYSGAEEHWEKTMKLAAPIAEVVDGLASDERDRVRETVSVRVSSLIAAGGSGIDGLTHVVSSS